MSDNNLSNGPPAAAYYFWCLDIRWGGMQTTEFPNHPSLLLLIVVCYRCDVRGSTYPESAHRNQEIAIHICDDVCDIEDLFTWTREEELDIRGLEFHEKHQQRIRLREQRGDYACTQCFRPGCVNKSSREATFCFCDLCSCR